MTEQWPYWVVLVFMFDREWHIIPGTTGVTQRDSRVRYQHMIDKYPDFIDMELEEIKVGSVRQSQCRIKVKT